MTFAGTILRHGARSMPAALVYAGLAAAGSSARHFFESADR